MSPEEAVLDDLGDLAKRFIRVTVRGMPPLVAAQVVLDELAVLCARQRCDAPFVMFTVWWLITGSIVSTVRDRACSHDGTPLITFAVLDEDGHRQELEDADPRDVLIGRWIAACGNEDYDTAHALWLTLDDDLAQTGAFIRRLVQRLPPLLSAIRADS